MLDMTVYDKPLVYLDNAATTQKPKQVIDRISTYYKYENCNIHRGVHFLSQHATEAFEDARKNIQQHINAASSHEIVFTKGTTESINLVASSLGRNIVNAGDEILVTEMEHHSNYVPWQMLAKEKNAIFKVIPINDEGDIELSVYKEMLNEKTRLVAVTHVSNVLGTINPVKHMIDLAHQMDIPVVVDGAQAMAHLYVDVQDLDCDFYCFSGHKVYGPMGIGVLYGKEKWLEAMPPYQGGGEMVNEVTAAHTTYNELPYKFEAGTPKVAGVLGVDAAFEYINDLEIKKIAEHEHILLDYATVELLNIGGLKIYGNSPHKTSVISFNIENIHPYDAGMIIDKLGVAVRTGHHCAQPVMNRYGVPGTIRASFALYNTKEEVDSLVKALLQVKKMLD